MNAAAPVSPVLSVPHVWRGRELARALDVTVPSGHAALDAQLPGGGWPLGCLVEVLQPQPEQHVWQLLGAGLAHCVQARPGPVVLVNPPHEPFAPALRGRGLDAGQWLWVDADSASARLWAAEQALRCGEVAAVLAWLPRVRNEELRRLHLCAQQQPDRLLVVLRGLDARAQASPARLRLLVQGTDTLEVRVLKRRGPPLLQALLLHGQPARLEALLAARRGRRAVPTVPTSPSDVLDRAASLAG